jgi:hypothetical protein
MLNPPALRNTIFIVAAICLGIRVSGQEKESRDNPIKIKNTADFEVTGDGNSEQWNHTEWIPLVKRKGHANYNTQAKLLYSTLGIYTLFKCSDKKITATLTEDYADLYEEDVVEIFFWTDETSPLYFEYELSPLNYELPILVPNFGGDFFGWKPWHYEGERKTRHATKIVKDASGKPTEWIAEFFIPYALLKPLQNVPPKSGTRWRMNMYRIDYDDEYSSWTWKPVTTNFHDYKEFGMIEFE